MTQLEHRRQFLALLHDHDGSLRDPEAAVALCQATLSDEQNLLTAEVRTNLAYCRLLGLGTPRDHADGTYVKSVLTKLVPLVRFGSTVAFVITLGGLAALLASMSKHQHCPDICGEGLRILAHLAFNDDNRVPIAARGGLDVIATAMHKHPVHTEITDQVCRALAILALNDDNGVTIVARGGLELIFAAMRNHPENADINKNACWALADLAINADNQAIIKARGGLELIFTAMRNHLTNADVNQYACLALANLALNDDNQVMIAAGGGLELIFAAMRNHPTHVAVNFEACRALANIAKSQRVAIEQSGVLAIVQAAVNRFPNGEGIQSAGRRLLL